MVFEGPPSYLNRLRLILFVPDRAENNGPQKNTNDPKIKPRSGPKTGI